MSLFGCKQICAFWRFVAVAAAILSIAYARAIASPITTLPDPTGMGISASQGLDPVPPTVPAGSAAPIVLPSDLDIRAEEPSLSELLGDGTALMLPSEPADLATNSLNHSSSAKPGDATLRQVLRGLLTRHSFDTTMALPSGLDPSVDEQPPIAKEGDRRAPRGSGLLDSRTAGRVLREFVDVQAETDRSVIFSVLGMGNFALEKSARSGAVTLSELSSGWSATLLPAYDPGRSDNGANRGSSPVASNQDGNVLWAVIAWTLDFVSSPLGIVLLMIAGVIAALAGVVRFAAFMRNRAAVKRRSRRRRRRRSSRSLATRSKTGQATR